MREPPLRRNVNILLTNAFFAELRLFYPICVLMYAAVAGSYTAAMSVFALLNISQAVLEIPLGVFSDRHGRKLTFMLGGLCEVLCILAYYLAQTTSAGLWGLYLGAFLYGVASAALSGNNEALLYETLARYRKSKQLPHMMGRISSMGQAGLALSGVIATFLLWHDFSYTQLTLLSLFPVLLAFLLTLFIQEPPVHSKEAGGSFAHTKRSILNIWKNPMLCRLALASAWRGGLGMAAFSFSPSYIESLWPLWLTPLFRTLQNALGVVGFWFSGRFAQKWGLIRSLWHGTLISNLLCLIGYSFATPLAPVWLLLTQLTYAVRFTSENAIKQELFTAQERSTMGSVIALTQAIFASALSLLIGLFADILSPQAGLLILLFATLPATAVYYGFYHNEKMAQKAESGYLRH